MRQVKWVSHCPRQVPRMRQPFFPLSLGCTLSEICHEGSEQQVAGSPSLLLLAPGSYLLLLMQTSCDRRSLSQLSINTGIWFAFAGSSPAACNVGTSHRCCFPMLGKFDRRKFIFSCCFQGRVSNIIFVANICSSFPSCSHSLPLPAFLGLYNFWYFFFFTSANAI